MRVSTVLWLSTSCRAPWCCQAPLLVLPSWLAVLPFYLLEVLVGLVQALVFALLTSVFTALMCEHHEEEHSH